MFRFLNRKPRYLSDTEYWVYIPEDALPEQDAIMDRLIKGVPDEGIPSTVGPQEGMLFSDLRLGIALALRSKNPHAFRPDLIGDQVAVTKQLLEVLAESNAMIKIRYLSEEPLADNRHLRLLPNLVVAAGALALAMAVYDVEAQMLFAFDNFVSALRTNPDSARPDFHVRSLWHSLESGGRAESRGLAKVGLKDFATKDMNTDEQVLVSAVVDEAARQLFATCRYPESLVVETFGDKFRVVFDQKLKDGMVQAAILRLQGNAP